MHWSTGRTRRETGAPLPVPAVWHSVRLAEKEPHLFTLQGTPILSLDNTFKVDVGSSSALRIACLLFCLSQIVGIVFLGR